MQVQGYGDIDEGSRRGDGEKWADNGYVLEVELAGVADYLDVGHKAKKEIQVDKA